MFLLKPVEHYEQPKSYHRKNVFLEIMITVVSALFICLFIVYSPVSPSQLGEIVDMLQSNTISMATAKKVGSW